LISEKQKYFFRSGLDKTKTQAVADLPVGQINLPSFNKSQEPKARFFHMSVIPGHRQRVARTRGPMTDSGITRLFNVGERRTTIFVIRRCFDPKDGHNSISSKT
jgi:hypothetical protein